MIIDSSVSKNFFGRENLLQVLQRIVASAKDGGANSILLSGKRGVGKTKLLANLYNRVFEQRDAVPFFYTVKKTFVTAEEFANDYLGSFILQALAFQENDPAVLSGLYSLGDLRAGAEEIGAEWVVDIIDAYMKVREEGEGAKTVLNAVSAPYRSYQITGIPVVVMIDDLHRIRRFSELKGNDIAPDFWMPFEASIRSLHVPHIFAGIPHEIENVYFEEPLMADQFEIIDLPCLDEENSIKLFRAMCEMYGLKVELEPADLIGVFGGNPLYIKNFLQAARQAGGVLSKEVFERTYYNEITRGKTYKYWTFILKNYMRKLDMRKPSLKLLYGLCGENKDEPMQPDQAMLDSISEILHDSGIVETGFSETMPADEILRDIIKGLYQREIEKESPSSIREPIAGSDAGQNKENSTASFVISIPADPKAGLVAIKSFEQIARNYNIPLKMMGKLQLAMADLFSNVFAVADSVENYKLQVRCVENMFSVEIITPQKDLVLTEQDTARIRAYVDDLKVESIDGGTLITLTKEIKEDFISPPGD